MKKEMTAHKAMVEMLSNRIASLRDEAIEVIRVLYADNDGSLYFRDAVTCDMYPSKEMIGIKSVAGEAVLILLDNSLIHESYADLNEITPSDLIWVAKQLAYDDINVFTKKLDVNRVRTLLKNAKPPKGCIILMSHYSINIQRENDGELLDADWDQFQELIGASMSVNDYDDLVVDMREDEQE